MVGTGSCGGAMKRYALPSIRASPHMAWMVPVQCLVQSSVKRSLIDQTLKYGSCVTRGTAGGRNAWCCARARVGTRATRQRTALILAAGERWRRRCMVGSSIESELLPIKVVFRYEVECIKIFLAG